MACCANHDRLDQVLHTEEYISQKCGDPKHVTTQTNQVTGGGLPTHSRKTVTAADGTVSHETKPAYCCADCPTLVAAHKAL
jgi:hypothetical protein